MTEALKMVAQCEKCGRGFVTMPKPGARDPFFPANKKPPREGTDEQCGGEIKPIGDKHANPANHDDAP